MGTAEPPWQATAAGPDLVHLGRHGDPLLMGGSSAKARRLRKEGRATVCVQPEDAPYRYVVADGPVTLSPLGDGTRAAVVAMASRYLGSGAGHSYAEQFSTPDEMVVELDPENWLSEVPGG